MTALPEQDRVLQVLPAGDVWRVMHAGAIFHNRIFCVSAPGKRVINQEDPGEFPGRYTKLK